MTQTFFAAVEPHQIYCSDKPEDATRVLDLKTPCTNLGLPVQRAHSYRVAINVSEDDPWKDDGVSADPQRGTEHETLWMMLGHPLKRVTNANWLQPITEVRADQTHLQRYLQWLVGKDIELRRLRFTQQPGGAFVSDDLCPRRTGQLHIMVDDAAPLLVPWPYWNNRGSATVTVTDLGRVCVPMPERR